MLRSGRLTRALAAAIWLLMMMPATAEETNYLVYLKGTEGKVAPFRVKWDELDADNARITVDAGTPYETWLRKLGLSRVLDYAAKRNSEEFIVRDAELIRFVTVVANDFVRGPQQVNVPPGVAPIPVGADVEQAMLLITPTPTQIEVIARLAISYLAPQPTGPPTRKDLVNGDIVFTGKREGKSP